MYKRWLFLLLLCLPVTAWAQDAGRQGVAEVKQCVMQNDIELCHRFLTPASYALFDRFFSYKLMPCLPTDFTYDSEQDMPGKQTVVQASLPADERNHYLFKLVFAGEPPHVRLDLPLTLQAGLGKDWQNKVNLTEQIYLMMRQNLKDKLTCDMLRGLVSPHKG